MKKSRGVLIWTTLAAVSYGQTRVDLANQARNVDFSSAASTRPVAVNTVLPATCKLGELIFKSDAPAGQNLYGCVATDTWALLGGEGGGGLPSPIGMAGKTLVSDGTNAVWGAQDAGAGLAKTTVGNDSIWSVDSAAVPFLALNNAFLGDNSYAGRTSEVPSATQSLAATSQIAPTATVVAVSAASAITLTSTPTIATGSDGQRVTVVNVGSNSITAQDEASLPGSGLCLIGDQNQTIPAKGAIQFTYNAAAGCWIQLGAILAGGGGGAVSSVFGRTGDVVAQAGDYTATQVGAVPDPGNTDDTLLVNNGSAWQAQGLPSCDPSTQKLHYDVATNTFSCQGDVTGGGGALPDQTGHAGKYLITDGSTASWGQMSPGSGLAKTIVGSDAVWSVDSAAVPFLALDNAFLGNNAWAGATAYTPSAVQTLTGTDAIAVANVSHKQISAAAAVTLTSTPTIADSPSDGQWVYLVNVGGNAITLQDESSLPNSNLCLVDDANQTLPAGGGAILLAWNSTAGCWVQLGAIAGGGGGLPAGSDDQVLVHDGSGWVVKTVPACNASTEKLHYDQATNSFSCQTDATVGGGSKSVVMWAGYEALAASTTAYFPPMGSLADHTSEVTRSVAWPVSGTFADPVIRLASSQGSDAGMVCTLRVNGADTSVTVTVPAGAGTGSVHTGSGTAAVVAGEAVVWKCANNSASGSAYMSSVALSFQQ